MKTTLMVTALLLFIFVENTFAQISFQKLYGDTVSNSSAFHSLQTSQGKYLATGYKNKYKRTDMVINCNIIDSTLSDTCYFDIYDDNAYCIMTDEYGDTLWTREYGDTASNVTGKLAIENSAGFLIIANKDYYATTLIQVDQSGQQLWEKNYFIGHGIYNEYTTGAQPCSNGYIITGHVRRSNLQDDIFLLKVAINGDSLWLKYFGDSLRNESSSTVKVTSDFGFVVTGSSSTTNTGIYGDIQLLKTDSSGNLSWYKTIGDTAMEQANYLDITSDGGYILLGNIAHPPSLDRDFYLVKTNMYGDTLWTKKYGSPNSNEYGQCVKQTYDHGYILSGIFSTGSIPLIKTDSSGTIQWTQEFNYSSLTYACGYVSQTSDSGFLMSGSVNSASNNWKYGVLLIKTNKDGNVVSVKEATPGTAIKLYPNPFHSSATLEFAEDLKNAELTIYNMMGTVMLKKTCSGKLLELERGNLNSGIYILSVRDKQMQYIQKIIVE